MNFQKYDDLFCRENYPVFNLEYLPEDNSACICLSGKEYGKCCKVDVEKAIQHNNDKKDCEELKKIYQRTEKKLISSKIVDKAINKKNISYCLAEKILGNCNICNNVKSHTLAKGNVLSNLSENDNVVVSFNDHLMIDIDMISNCIELYYTEVKLEDASLTVSFCKDHDRELFLEIETDGNCNYSNTGIETLEYALKAISFQIYYYIENVRYLSELIKTSKNVLSSCDGCKSDLLKQYSICVDELFRLYPLSQRIIEEIKNFKQGKKDIKLKTVYIKIPCKKINISCSEVIEEQGIYYFINVVNAPEAYMIFSYYEGENKKVWINEIKNKFENRICKQDDIYNFMLSFVITNAQNIYMNRRKFKQLSDEEKRYLYVVHREGTANIPENVHRKYSKGLYSFFFEG